MARNIDYRTANEQVMRSLRFAYRDRRQLKREMRKLWITVSMLPQECMI